MSNLKKTFIAQAQNIQARCRWEKWICPARILEETTGIKGISASWKMPQGKSEEYIGGISNALFYKEYLKKSPFSNNISLCAYSFLINAQNITKGKQQAPCLFQLLKEAIELNPELEAIKYKKTDPSHAYHFLMGIASGFNCDDIQHYIKRKSSQAPKDFERITQLKQDIGHEVGWATSPKTEKKIRSQLLPEQTSLLKADIGSPK